MRQSLRLFFDPTGKKPTEFEFYYGPKRFRLLQNIEDNVSFTNKDLQMQRLVYLGCHCLESSIAGSLFMFLIS